LVCDWPGRVIRGSSLYGQGSGNNQDGSGMPLW